MGSVDGPIRHHDLDLSTVQAAYVNDRTCVSTAAASVSAPALPIDPDFDYLVNANHVFRLCIFPPTPLIFFMCGGCWFSGTDVSTHTMIQITVRQKLC